MKQQKFANWEAPTNGHDDDCLCSECAPWLYTEDECPRGYFCASPEHHAEPYERVPAED